MLIWFPIILILCCGPMIYFRSSETITILLGGGCNEIKKGCTLSVSNLFLIPMITLKGFFNSIIFGYMKIYND